MIEFLMPDTKECPYCKKELEIIEIKGEEEEVKYKNNVILIRLKKTDDRKQLYCRNCNKKFEIAWLLHLNCQRDYRIIGIRGKKDE